MTTFVEETSSCISGSQVAEDAVGNNRARDGEGWGGDAILYILFIYFFHQFSARKSFWLLKVGAPPTRWKKVYKHLLHLGSKNSLDDLRGSKMYVTLEPCNHYGKTPPCTSKIIKSGISEVFYSMNDIDKKVKGKKNQPPNHFQTRPKPVRRLVLLILKRWAL